MPSMQTSGNLMAGLFTKPKSARVSGPHSYGFTRSRMALVRYGGVFLSRKNFVLSSLISWAFLVHSVLTDEKNLPGRYSLMH